MLRFCLVLLFCVSIECQLRSIGTERGYKFTIKTTWNGDVVPEAERVQINLRNYENSNDLILIIDAPFYNDPAPDGEANEPYIGLWDYEVVQAFFLNDKNQYLEVEIGPHGQHLVLLLNGKRNTIRHSLPLEVRTSIVGLRWIGEAIIPGEYFPPQVTKFNAYASHGLGSGRQHLALYPADGSTDEPDIHDLELFQSLNMKSINNVLPEDKKYSSIWDAATEGIFNYQITQQWNGFQTNIPPTIFTLQGFQDGVEVNYTMPSDVQFYPPHSFVIAIENDEGESIKIQLFADGSHLIDFLVNREEKINVENPPLDYRINTKIPGVIAGSALVPPSYFPPMANLMNAYVLFGNERMLAMSLNPVNIDLEDVVPDINSLEHFSSFDFNMLVNSNIEYSNVWRNLLDMPLLTELHRRTPIVIDFRHNERPQKTGRKDIGLSNIPKEKSTLDVTNQNIDQASEETQKEESKPLDDSSSTDNIKEAKEQQNDDQIAIIEEYETTPDSVTDETTLYTNPEHTENYEQVEMTTELSEDENDSEVTQTQFGRPFRYVLNRREKTPERDEHQRRYEESDSDINELPITFEITIKAMDKGSDSEQKITSDTVPKDKDDTSIDDGPLVIVRPVTLQEVETSIPEDVGTNEHHSFDVPEIVPTTLIPDIPLSQSLPISPEEKKSDNTPEITDSLPAEQNSADFKIPQSPIPEDPEISLFPDITEIADEQVISILKDLGLPFDTPAFATQQIYPSQTDELEDVKIIPPLLELPILPEGDRVVEPEPDLPDFLDTSKKPKTSSTEEESNKVLTPGATEIFVPEDLGVIPSEISDTIENVDSSDLLPPPHPLCFAEGLVPDEIRCQIFYECVIENGKWEVYRWRCRRGFYYDPETVACLRGFC